jgi:dipeptidyl-peptidase 4
VSKRFDEISLEDVATFPRPGTAVPGKVGFSSDGAQVTFLWSSEGSLVRSLWACDLTGGERRLMAQAPAEAADESTLSREEVLRRERARLREVGITDYSFAQDADALLVPLRGELLVRQGAGELQVVAGARGGLDARLSRDARRLGFVRDDDLFVADLAAGGVRRLTDTAAPGFTNGVAEFAAHEELGRSRGWWFSPNGARIAYVEADSRHVPELPIVHQGTPQVDVEHHRYPFAGADNATVRLGVIGVEGGETTWLDLTLDGEARDIYLARVAWRPSGEVCAAVLDRGQRHLAWFAFDPVSGERRLLREERSEPWLNLDHDTRFLDSGETLFSSERTGFRHLYLQAADGGQARQLTTGEWMVSQLCEVDQVGRMAYFVGTERGVRERHVYAVSLDVAAPEGADAPLRRLTREPGWHGAVFARDCRHFVDTWSSLQHGPRVVVRQVEDGSEVVTVHDDPEATAEALGLVPPRPIQLQADDGTTLEGLIYDAVGAATPGPGVVSLYGGPHAQMVRDEWLLTVDLRAQHLARRGTTVLRLDNRGAAGRGLAFEAALNRRMGTVEVEDQLVGARHLQGLPQVDPARIGVYGWSYGGYMTLLCLLKAGDTFKAGVSGAPVTFWEGYDTAYTERYMGRPRDNPDGYEQASVLTHVDRLQGALLVVHGMIDENVHFRHTARLLKALGEANQTCQLLALPQERHMPRDKKGLLYLETRVFEFLRDQL